MKIWKVAVHRMVPTLYQIFEVKNVFAIKSMESVIFSLYSLSLLFFFFIVTYLLIVKAEHP